MKTIHLLPQHIPSLPDLALTIGNYDGVHLGHQALIDLLTTTATKEGLASAVMVFEPQPREFFSPDDPPARLSSLAEKTEQLGKLGVDYLLVASFDEAFRALSAEAFMDLLNRLNVRKLVLGDDFRFGQGRVGDASLLQQAGFGVLSLDSINIDGRRVSSSLLRAALAVGDLTTAKQLLGRDYAITGEVVHGDKIGRTLDFPTANVALSRIKPALHGVLAADVIAYRDGKRLAWQTLGTGGVAGLAAGSLFAAANIGLRPAVGGSDWRLEVHLPEFVGDLYGLQLQVVFLHYLHGERHYSSLDELKQGIAQDVKELLVWRAAIG